MLFTFSLFMLSLTHRQDFLQVGNSFVRAVVFTAALQVYLAQGLANGIAMGMLYVPSLAIVSHYFKRRRAFVMGISAAVGQQLQLTNIMLNVPGICRGRSAAPHHVK